MRCHIDPQVLPNCYLGEAHRSMHGPWRANPKRSVKGAGKQSASPVETPPHEAANFFESNGGPHQSANEAAPTRRDAIGSGTHWIVWKSERPGYRRTFPTSADNYGGYRARMQGVEENAEWRGRKRRTPNAQRQRRIEDRKHATLKSRRAALCIKHSALGVFFNAFASSKTSPRISAGRRSKASSDCSRAAFSPSKYPRRSQACRRVARATG